MNTIKFLRSISALAVMAAMPVLADDADIDTIEVTATRVTANLDEIPSTITVIEQEDIERLMPNQLSDLFRYEAGVAIASSGSRFGDANINIRGIGGNRVLYVKDGIQVTEGFGGQAGVTQGRGNFDPFILQRVEILKGPASALYGSNALGGVVVINSAQPKSLIEDSGRDIYASVNAGYFGVDKRRRLGGSVATKLGESYLLVQGQGQKFKERDINSDVTPNPKDGKIYNVNAKWQFEKDRHSFQVIGEYYNEKVDNILSSGVNALNTARDKSTRGVFGLRHEMSDLGFADTLTWQANYQTSQYTQYQVEQDGNTLTEEWEEFKQDQISLSALSEKELGKHRLLVGVEGFFTSLELPVDKVETDLTNNTQTRVIQDITYPGKSFPDTDVTKLGIFVQDYFQATERLKLIGGIRYDYFKNKPKPDAAFENFTIVEIKPETYTDDAFSPHAGAVFDLTDRASVYGNYSKGFRTPPVGQQYISRSIFNPRFIHEIVPNNELKSEKSEGLEVGLRWSSDTVRFSFAAYRNTFKNFIDSGVIGTRDVQLDPDDDTVTTITQIQYRNVDRVRIKGLELNAQIIIDEVLPNDWSGTLNLVGSIIDGKNITADQGLNSVPPNNAIIGLTLSPADSFQFTTNLNLFDKADKAALFLGRLEAFEPPSYATVDLSAQWQLAERFSINAAVYNLFNKKYWPYSAKGEWVNFDLEPLVAPGRNFAVSASFKF